MKKTIVLGLLFSLWLGVNISTAKATTIIPFDFDWKFALGDYPQAVQPSFDDAGWRILDVPHDWSIEGTYHETANGTDWQSGYLPCGTGWYRKHFSLEKEWDGKEVAIHFDGIYMNSSVWINGHFLGNRPYGYIGFEYDLTPYLRKGDNVVTVLVDHSKPLSGRWYTGSGIYRHVWLHVRNSIHIPTWGVCFTSAEVSKEKAVVEVKTIVMNNTEVKRSLELFTSLKKKDGKTVSTKKESIVTTGGDQLITQKMEVKLPLLWSPDSPNIYQLYVEIKENGKTVDSKLLPVGIRKAEYSTQGYVLNGERILIKGVCDHHTAGALGAAIPDQALERRLRILKAMGGNAIRTAHNPFSPQFYTICDTLGLIVMDEAFDGWEEPKGKDDYGNYFKEWWERDLTDLILRDRNHSSVLFWSIGNEVHGGTPETQKKLVDLIHKLDPTRPVTQGGSDPTRGMKADYNKDLYLDIIGFNGNGEEVGEFEKFGKNMPDRCGIGTEVPHSYQTRGVYRTKTAWRRRDFPAPWELKTPIPWDKFKHRVFEIPDLSETEVFPEEAENKYYQSSYDNASVRIGVRHSWKRSSSFPWLFGEFRWGSFDYLGEAVWPQRCGNFGIIDICGFPKDHYYLYQSLWSEKPMVHILPHWTHTGKEGVRIPVVVYTNCEGVELFLNGRSLGKKPYKGDQLVWQVPFEAGEIKAIATNGATQVEKSYHTAGNPAAIAMSPDKLSAQANRTDVVHLELDIIDEKGTICPYADNEVHFNINGPAKLIGVDNGDPIDLSPYKIPQRKAFRGKVILMIQTTGEAGIITVEAISPGLRPAVVKIDSKEI